MTPEAWAAFAGLAVTLAVIIYAAGKQAARVDSLEEWRREVSADVKIMRALLENISGAIGARKMP